MVIEGYLIISGRFDTEILFKDEANLLHPFEDLLQENLSSEFLPLDDAFGFGKVNITIEQID